jgi:hypothetical protein
MSGEKVGKWIREGNDIEVIIPSAETMYKGKKLPKRYTFRGTEENPVRFKDIEKCLKSKLKISVNLKRSGKSIGDVIAE